MFPRLISSSPSLCFSSSSPSLRLLGDETKGWIDVTYMNESCTFRLSRGNKGTLFILVREKDLEQEIVELINQAKKEGQEGDERVLDLIAALDGSSSSSSVTSSSSSSSAAAAAAIVADRDGMNGTRSTSLLPSFVTRAVAGRVDQPALSPLIEGRWKLEWSQQADNASALQKFGSQQSESYQIIDCSE